MPLTTCLLLPKVVGRVFLFVCFLWIKNNSREWTCVFYKSPLGSDTGGWYRNSGLALQCSRNIPDPLGGCWASLGTISPGEGEHCTEWRAFRSSSKSSRKSSRSRSSAGTRSPGVITSVSLSKDKVPAGRAWVALHTWIVTRTEGKIALFPLASFRQT